VYEEDIRLLNQFMQFGSKKWGNKNCMLDGGVSMCVCMCGVCMCGCVCVCVCGVCVCVAVILNRKGCKGLWCGKQSELMKVYNILV